MYRSQEVWRREAGSVSAVWGGPLSRNEMSGWLLACSCRSCWDLTRKHKCYSSIGSPIADLLLVGLSGGSGRLIKILRSADQVMLAPPRRTACAESLRCCVARVARRGDSMEPKPVKRELHKLHADRGRQCLFPSAAQPRNRVGDLALAPTPATHLQFALSETPTLPVLAAHPYLSCGSSQPRSCR